MPRDLLSPAELAVGGGSSAGGNRRVPVLGPRVLSRGGAAGDVQGPGGVGPRLEGHKVCAEALQKPGVRQVSFVRSMFA